jgi:GNAT superfamily N-acetyltransferase
MTLSLRPALGNDINFLVDIDLKSYDYPWSIDKWQSLAFDPTCVIVLAIINVEPVGFVAWRKKTAIKEAEILRLAVKPAYRKCGVGSLLLSSVEITACESGLQEIVIIVPEVYCFPGHKNDVSQWLLARGFRAVAPIFKNYFDLYGSKVDGFKFVGPADVLGENNAKG